MFQDLLRQVPQWALVAFLGISDEFTSAEVLGTFQTNHPSFFVLARQFSGKLTIPSIGYSKSFFFATPNGVLSTTGYIDERVAARTVWSAIHLIQALLGDMLLQYCVLRENMVVEPHIPRLRASFAHIELYLLFLRVCYLGRRPAYLFIENVFCCAQGLHQLLSWHVYGRQAIPPSWYVTQDCVNLVLFESGRWNILPIQRFWIPFDIDSAETQWLLAQIPQRLPIAHKSLSAFEIQENRENALRQELVNAIGPVWPPEFNPPLVTGSMRRSEATPTKVNATTREAVSTVYSAKRRRRTKGHRHLVVESTRTQVELPPSPIAGHSRRENQLEGANSLHFSLPLQSPSRLLSDENYIDLFHLLNSFYYLSSQTPPDIRQSFNRISALQSAYYTAAHERKRAISARERERADSILTCLFNDICRELCKLRSLCPEPLPFLHLLVSVDSDKAMSLRDWDYLCLIMQWHVPWAFDTYDQFNHFIRSHTLSKDVLEDVPSPISPLTPLPEEESDWEGWINTSVTHSERVSELSFSRGYQSAP